ncbi:MAG TPA: hypothetical protein VHB50_00630, partial [Bryobacteraceae bacterium]|nr:hypothetical protein [Bryobacteraceae bacterium]
MRKLVLSTMALAGCGVVVLAGQQPATRAVYTAAQADAGRTAYRSSCVKCHGEDLIPPAGAQYMGQTIPPLAGPKFLSRWNGQATSDLAIRIKTAI